MKRPCPSCAALLAAALLPLGARAQTPLPLGTTAKGGLSEGQISEYVFEAREAGFLTVILRAEGSEDLVLFVTDEEEQELPDGRSDQDLGGNPGAEQLMVTLTAAGRYRAFVATFMGGSPTFQIGGSFLASKLAVAPSDPDGRPSTALELAVGDSHEDSLTPNDGDRWDWYRMSVTAGGALTVLTRSDGDGDLALEVFREGEYREPIDASDEDMEGVMGNESVTMDVAAGDVLYLRVLTRFGGGLNIPYRVTSGLIPG